MVEFVLMLFGLVFGSFINMLTDRIPKNESIVWKPSHCDHCKKPLRWFELIPVVSYIVIGGRCLRCKKRLPVIYPLVEVATASGFVGSYMVTQGDPLPFVVLSVMWTMSVAIFVIDWQHQIIPDSLLIIMGIGSLAHAALSVPGAFITHAVTAVISGLFFFVLWFVTRGKGLGFGDVKLALVMGVFLGHPYTVIAFYCAFLTGAISGVILMSVRRAHMKSRIAFGPFLLIGMWVARFWGDAIFAWWQQLL